MTAFVIEAAYASASQDGSWIDVAVPDTLMRPSLV